MSASTMVSLTVTAPHAIAWVDLFPVQPNGAQHGTVVASVKRVGGNDVRGGIGRVSYRPDCKWFAVRGCITENLLNGKRGVLKGDDLQVRYFDTAAEAGKALLALAREEVGA